MLATSRRLASRDVLVALITCAHILLLNVVQTFVEHILVLLSLLTSYITVSKVQEAFVD